VKTEKKKFVVASNKTTVQLSIADSEEQEGKQKRKNAKLKHKENEEKRSSRNREKRKQHTNLLFCIEESSTRMRSHQTLQEWVLRQEQVALSSPSGALRHRLWLSCLLDISAHKRLQQDTRREALNSFFEFFLTERKKHCP
jgi:hypothetical protein